MPAGNAHRILSTLYEAFTSGIGPGILNDPGDAGTIGPTVNFQVCEMVSAAVETRTLRNPNRAGVRFLIRMKTDCGNITLTGANGLNVGGNTGAVFADVGDQLELVSVSHTTGYRWEILVNTGSVSLS